jgi:hypothetical protein
MIRSVLGGLFIAACSAGMLVVAQDNVPATGVLPDISLVKGILALPVSLPDGGTEAENQREPATPMQRRVSLSPPEDAPLGILADYWSEFAGDHPAITPRTQERLLDACEAEPRYLANLLQVLPDTATAHARIKGLFDAEGKAPRFNSEWTAAVRKYLLYHTRYFIQDLGRAARAAHDEDDSLKGEDDLKALARLDWTAADPILAAHASSENHRVAALSLSLLYAHSLAVSERRAEAAYRERLKRVVEDRSRPGRARDIAAEALLASNWEGRDEWYWSLFRDPTLRDLKDGYLMMSPLCQVDMDTSEWIRQLAMRLAGTDRPVRDAAVTCLVQFQLDSARRDALLPLLPWLSDPNWSSARDRLRLIQSMDRVEMPESVPGLIAVLGQKDETECSYAAESLAHYKDKRAAPALRRALDRLRDGDDRMRIARAIIQCGGVDSERAARSVEAYAAQISTEKGAEELESMLHAFEPSKRPASDVLIGLALSTSSPPDDAVSLALLARSRTLEARQPSIAKALLGIVGRWPGQAVDAELTRRIGGGRADTATVHLAVLRREQVRKTQSSELTQILAVGGVRVGIAAVLLGREHDIQAVLSGSDTLAQSACLATARLARESIATDVVGHLLGNTDQLVATAAEAYLVSQDNPEARTLVLARHRGEALILGARQQWDPGHTSYSAFDELEKQLREEARGGSDLYALLSAGYWGSVGQIIVRLGETPEVMYVNDPARYHTRSLSIAEVNAFREFISSSGIEAQEPLTTTVVDGTQYEYVRVSADGGRRVFMNNPGVGGTGGSVYARACDYFRKLVNTGTFTLSYRAASTIPGFELLASDGRSPIMSVWKRDADVRVLVSGVVEGSATSSYAAGGQVVVAVPERGREKWFSFEDGQIKGAATAPVGFTPSDVQDGLPAKMQVDENRNQSLWALNTGEYRYRVAQWKGKEGFWRCAAGKAPVLLVEGNVGTPVVTPDGKWALIAKTDTDWSKPNYVLRVDLATGQVYRLNIPVADTFNPVAYIPAHRKILLERSRDADSESQRRPVGPETPEFQLVDPLSGKNQLVTGEFEPLFGQGLRALQPTGTPDEVWATRHDRKGGMTEVGRYDMKRFEFRSVLSVPLEFGSMQMWVDADEEKVYVAYNGHLIRMHLPK